MNGDSYVWPPPNLDQTPVIDLYDEQGNFVEKIALYVANRLQRRGVVEICWHTSFFTLTLKSSRDILEHCKKLSKDFGKKLDRRKPRALLSRNYDSIIFRNKDNEIIFLNNIQKAMWYVSHGLCEVTNKDPLELKFIVEVNGPGHKNDPFGLIPTENKCVVCGCQTELTRHHVVPYCYRKHMKKQIKSNSFHDIVLLCVSCHYKYEVMAEEFKKELLESYQVEIEKVVLDRDILKSRGYIWTIRQHGEKIPSEKRQKMQDFVDQTMKTKGMSYQDIENHSNKMEITPSSALVYKMKDEKEFQEFIQRWRTHFIEQMNPQYMPKLWSVNRSITRHDSGRVSRHDDEEIS